MKKLYSLLILIFAVQSLYAQINPERDFQKILETVYQAHPEAVGIMLHVEAPKQNISWSGAVGLADRENKIPIEADQPALIASSIKTYVSATILRLVESRKLSVDDAIAPLVKKETKQLFTSDGYDFSEIKVKHLLSHTSGIEDYANKAYIDKQTVDPRHRWTRNEQLQLAVTVGNPLGKPGEQFSYADANYLLLTEIIEGKTGKPFYTAMRELLKYEELGLQETWFPTLEEKPADTKELVHQYWDDLKWDSYDFDVSWDLYGGGGIATTTKDLARFNQALFTGKIVEDEAIRDLIFTEIKTKETELTPYYLGLAHDSYHGMNGFGHGGFWGTTMLYFPTLEASVAVFVNNRSHRILQRDVFEAVTKVLLQERNKTENPDARVKAYLEQLEDFSGTITVAKSGQISEQRAYGLANIEMQVENKTDTKFNIASISKLITSIGVLRLVEQGKIKPEQTVGEFLPDYPNPVIRDSATIHHLLSHQAGIPPFYGKDYLASDKSKYKKLADFVPLFANLPLSFNPGERYEYGGGNFVLLGLIIEKVTGMCYYDYIREQIFKPAGMMNSTEMPVDSVVMNKASGYTSSWGDKNYLSRNDYTLSITSGAASYYSTGEDLTKFTVAFLNGTLISEKTKKLLLTPKVKGYNTHLGYGIDIDQRYSEHIVGHSGGWFGVRTELMAFLASGYTVIVLSNQDDNGQRGASKVIDDLREIIGGEKKR